MFDLFHVIKQFNKEMNAIRNKEFSKAKGQDKSVIKGSRYILLKKKTGLDGKEKEHLRELLKVNENISTAYILRDMLKKLWDYRYPKCATKALNNWCSLARESGIPKMMRFAKMIDRYAYGIINHCYFPINSGRIEGSNNTLKVIKRDAYGYRDTEYFILKCKQTFPGKYAN